MISSSTTRHFTKSTGAQAAHPLRPVYYLILSKDETSEVDFTAAECEEYEEISWCVENYSSDSVIYSPTRIRST